MDSARDRRRHRTWKYSWAPRAAVPGADAPATPLFRNALGDESETRLTEPAMVPVDKHAVSNAPESA